MESGNIQRRVSHPDQPSKIQSRCKTKASSNLKINQCYLPYQQAKEKQCRDPVDTDKAFDNI